MWQTSSCCVLSVASANTGLGDPSRRLTSCSMPQCASCVRLREKAGEAMTTAVAGGAPGKIKAACNSKIYAGCKSCHGPSSMSNQQAIHKSLLGCRQKEVEGIGKPAADATGNKHSTLHHTASKGLRGTEADLKPPMNRSQPSPCAVRALPVALVATGCWQTKVAIDRESQSINQMAPMRVRWRESETAVSRIVIRQYMMQV